MRHSVLYLAGIVPLATASLASSEETTNRCTRKYPIHCQRKPDKLKVACYIVEEVLDQLRKKSIRCRLPESTHYLNVINYEVQHQLEMKDFCAHFEKRLAQALATWAGLTPNYATPWELVTKEQLAVRAKRPT